MPESLSLKSSLRLTVLGSGTSMGVPTLGCHCAVCQSKDPHDNRMRPSVLLSRDGHHVVIDTTPDFRSQGLRVKLDRLDAVVYTHGHADHILGFDDIRAFSLRQQQALPIYGSAETIETLRHAFSYVFDGRMVLSTIPRVTVNIISEPFELLGTLWTPIPVEHGNIDVFGYRVGGLVYITDFSRLPDSSKELAFGADELMIDALRDTPHPMHQTVAQALDLVRELQPKRAWFTHIAHDLPHEETNQRFARLGFPQVQLAYDGLTFEVRV